MITCDECGRENDEEYKFCLGCGAALEQSAEEEEPAGGETEIINCPYCGAEQPVDFKFCGSCGEKIPDVGSGGGDSKATTPGKPGGEGPSAGSAGGGVNPASGGAGASSPGVSGPAASNPGASGPGASGPGDQPPPMPSNIPSGSSTPGQGGLSGKQESSEPTAQASVTETGARLVVIRPDGTEGASIAVPKDKLTIGRDSEVEALSSDPFLSPNHASVLHDGGDYIIHDESSLNGIFREVTDEVELQDGDLIRIGQELLSFETRGDDPHADADGTLEAGSENPGYWGRLGIVAGPDVETEAYALDEDEITIGRESGDIVFRDDGFVSGTHAQVALSNGSPVLRDLNSSNGTFIRIRGDYQLDDGERVLMGQQLFRLETS